VREDESLARAGAAASRERCARPVGRGSGRRHGARFFFRGQLVERTPREITPGQSQERLIRSGDQPERPVREVRERIHAPARTSGRSRPPDWPFPPPTSVAGRTGRARTDPVRRVLDFFRAPSRVAGRWPCPPGRGHGQVSKQTCPWHPRKRMRSLPAGEAEASGVRRRPFGSSEAACFSHAPGSRAGQPVVTSHRSAAKAGPALR